MKKFLVVCALLACAVAAGAQNVTSAGIPCPSGFHFRGAWQKNVPYSMCDIAFNPTDGSAYIAAVANIAAPPPSARWQMFAAGGAPGKPGTDGSNGKDGGPGPAGPPGPDIAGLSGDGQGNVKVAKTLTAWEIDTISTDPPAFMLGGFCPAPSTIPAGHFAICIDPAKSQLACLKPDGSSCLGAMLTLSPGGGSGSILTGSGTLTFVPVSH